jgi:hypothetical protein
VWNVKKSSIFVVFFFTSILVFVVVCCCCILENIILKGKIEGGREKVMKKILSIFHRISFSFFSSISFFLFFLFHFCGHTTLNCRIKDIWNFSLATNSFFYSFLTNENDNIKRPSIKTLFIKLHIAFEVLETTLCDCDHKNKMKKIQQKDRRNSSQWSYKKYKNWIK